MTPRPLLVDIVPHPAQYSAPFAMQPAAMRAALAMLRGVDVAGHIAAVRRESADMPDRDGPDRGESQGGGPEYFYTYFDGDVARVQVRGVLLKYGASLVDGPAMVWLRHDVRTLRDDPRAAAVLVEIDSPGGSVYGLDDLARDLRALAQVKPVHAFIEDLGASAAYYLASQARRINAAPSAMVGCIGTFAVIEDWSVAYETAGVTVHVLRSGVLKGAGTEGTKITEEQLAAWQKEVDFYGSMFAGMVASGRGLTSEAVAELHTGECWNATDSVTRGLIDRVAGVDETMTELRATVAAQEVKPAAAGIAMRTRDRGIAEMDDDNEKVETPAERPAAATLAELKAAFPKSTADFREACLEAGDTVEAATRRWADTLAAQLETVNAETDTLRKQLQAAKTVGVGEQAVGFAGSDAAVSTWGNNAELRQEFRGNKGDYEAWSRAVENGLVRAG
jgi:signal peptide peptidase SppA